MTNLRTSSSLERLKNRRIYKEIAQEVRYCTLSKSTFEVGTRGLIALVLRERRTHLGSSLRSQSLRQDLISQARDIIITLFDDSKGKDSDIRSNDASTDGLADSLSLAARSVA